MDQIQFDLICVHWLIPHTIPPNVDFWSVNFGSCFILGGGAMLRRNAALLALVSLALLAGSAAENPQSDAQDAERGGFLTRCGLGLGLLVVWQLWWGRNSLMMLAVA